MIERFVLPAGLLSGFSSGYGDGPGVEFLWQVQISKRLQQIAVIAGRAPGSVRPAPAVAMLAAAQRRAPGPVARVLSDPWVGAWAGGTARGLVTGRHPVPRHLEHLNSLAVAAAVAAGLDGEVSVPVHSGRVVLPALGESVSTTSRSRVSIRVVPGGLLADGVPLFLRRPLRLTAADGMSVSFETRDPYRDCFDMPVDRGSAEDRIDRWRSLFSDAWALLARHLPRRAEELRIGLRSLVPLFHATGKPGVSVTSGQAFGGLGLTEPHDALGLAMTLIHEFQHSKLCALLDLVRLYEPDPEKRFFAPWRPDPRPVSGFLQGVYAFAAIAAAFDTLRHVAPLRDRAETELAFLRVQLAAALPELRAAPALTPAGRAFVDGMAAALEPVLAAPGNPARDRAARASLTRTVVRWRIQHVNPPEDEVKRLVSAYPDDLPPGPAVDTPERWAELVAPEERPELVRAVYLGVLVRNGHPPEVPALVAWLRTASVTAP